ncbi:MAG: DUF1887 family protein [Ruminococcaceae bacterium]|nr:DUF1887 family protein [Oscillospiraceae bacterium]
METLIELYDERPLENVLGVEMFRPERVVYVCPEQIGSDQRVQRRLAEYFEHRGLALDITFANANTYDAGHVLSTLRNIVRKYPDCAVDITGGTDAVLFAAGLLSAEIDVPVFTYSRKMNRFYNIKNAPFADKLHCDLEYAVDDLVCMAGGSVRTGRVDNSVLRDYFDIIDPFFKVYLAHRRKWNRIVTFIQRVSPFDGEGPVPLDAHGAYTVKGDRGSRIDAPEDALRRLEELGLITALSIDPEKGVSFRFRDKHVRAWLRDVGSVLELFVYKTCIDANRFFDVRLSAIIDWEGDGRQNTVTNELDVLCTSGVTPLFISCKTPLVRTEALNELAILRDRFGGQMARAAIVTGERAGAMVRSRADELNISVIDLDDLTKGRLISRIKSVMK